jgi:hypothetical protein
MNNDLKKYQIENMVFQAKQTTKDALLFVKVFVALGIAISLISLVLK